LGGKGDRKWARYLKGSGRRESVEERKSTSLRGRGDGKVHPLNWEKNRAKAKTRFCGKKLRGVTIIELRKEWGNNGSE